MILYILVTLLVILIAAGIKQTAYSDSTLTVGRVKNMARMGLIFMLLFLLAALRVEVGNDYGTYVVTCHEIFQRGYVVTEPGFNLIVRILYTLSGSENHILMFAFFAALIVGLFLKCFRDQSESLFWSVVLFMLLGVYFRSFNTVRYYLALAMALYSLRYLTEVPEDKAQRIQNLIKFLAVIIIAATMHKSVLAVIPMYLLAGVKWNKWVIGVLGVLGVVGIVLKDKLIELALILYPSYRDTIYIEQTGSLRENLPIIGRCILVLVLCAVTYKVSIEGNVGSQAKRGNVNIGNRTYMNLSIMAVILYVTTWWLPLVTRFGYYMITPQLLLIPGVIHSVEESDPDKAKKLKWAVLAVSIAYFIYFLYTADREGVRVLPYKSWLFTDRYWLNQTDTF